MEAMSSEEVSTTTFPTSETFSPPSSPSSSCPPHFFPTAFPATFADSSRAKAFCSIVKPKSSSIVHCLNDDIWAVDVDPFDVTDDLNRPRREPSEPVDVDEVTDEDEDEEEEYKEQEKQDKDNDDKKKKKEEEEEEEANVRVTDDSSSEGSSLGVVSVVSDHDANNTSSNTLCSWREDQMHIMIFNKSKESPSSSSVVTATTTNLSLLDDSDDTETTNVVANTTIDNNNNKDPLYWQQVQMIQNLQAEMQMLRSKEAAKSKQLDQVQRQYSTLLKNAMQKLQDKKQQQEKDQKDATWLQCSCPNIALQQIRAILLMD